MFLASTSDIIRVITGSGVSSITVQADWADFAAGSTTPGRTDTAISTATTTTVVGSPAASTYRSIKGVGIANTSTSSCLVTVEHYDGTTAAQLAKVTLAAGERLVMSDEGKWLHLTAAGTEHEFTPPAGPCYGPTGVFAESFPRSFATEAASGALTSGQPFLVAILLRKGQLVSNIWFMSGAAATSPTHWFFALYDDKFQLCAQSTDQTTTAWAATTMKTLAMTTPYTVPKTGLYYLMVMMTATTAVQIKLGLSRSGSTLTVAGQGNILGGVTNSGLSTALESPPATLPGGATAYLWGGVS